MTQLYLEGFHPPKRPQFLGNDRLLLLIRPEAAALGQIVRLAGELRAEYLPSNWSRPPLHPHVTLHHLGDYPELTPDIIERATTAGGAIKVPAFQVVCDRVEGTGGTASLLARAYSPELLRLRRALGTALDHAGLPVREYFEPHVTMFYGDVRFTARRIEPIRWTVRGFELIRSKLGQGEWESLGRWTLEG